MNQFVHRGTMSQQNPLKKPTVIVPGRIYVNDSSTHPTWRAFIEYCAELKHGQIEVLKIQDGLPVLAEVTRKKIKFVP